MRIRIVRAFVLGYAQDPRSKPRNGDQLPNGYSAFLIPACEMDLRAFQGNVEPGQLFQ